MEFALRLSHAAGAHPTSPTTSDCVYCRQKISRLSGSKIMFAKLFIFFAQAIVGSRFCSRSFSTSFKKIEFVVLKFEGENQYLDWRIEDLFWMKILGFAIFSCRIDFYIK